MLWFDARLSKGQDVSCNSCHDVTKAGADDAPISTGTKKQGKRGTRRPSSTPPPSAQGWDARATLVEELVVPHAAEPPSWASTRSASSRPWPRFPPMPPHSRSDFPMRRGRHRRDHFHGHRRVRAKLLTPGRWDKFLGGNQSCAHRRREGRTGRVHGRQSHDVPRRPVRRRRAEPEARRREAWPSTRTSDASRSPSRRSIASSSRCRRFAT